MNATAAAVLRNCVLSEMVPLDVERVLDLGCGSGRWSYRIAKLLPWVEVTGVDAGPEFIAEAQREYADRRIRFELLDFGQLSPDDGTFDCVYADNALQHCFDLGATLGEVYRVLKNGGCLVASVPPEGLNLGQDSDNHIWRTIGPQLLRRLERAGFCNIRVDEIDTFRQLGMAPFRLSKDRMLYARAWKVAGGEDRLQRVIRAMNWLYRRIDPTRSNASRDGKKIIAEGYAYCLGYAVALGQLLKREGYDVWWVTMLADGHEGGSGSSKRESHEVIEVTIAEKRYTLDPTTNTFFPHSIDELVRTPHLADEYANRDERCRKRGYHCYNSSYWYKRVTWLSRRRSIRFHRLFWRRASR